MALAGATGSTIKYDCPVIVYGRSILSNDYLQLRSVVSLEREHQPVSLRECRQLSLVTKGVIGCAHVATPLRMNGL